MQATVIHSVAASAQATNAPSPRLVRAAHEFEGQMMKELLQPMSGAMTGTDGLTGDQDDSGSGSSLGEFASEALGQALSQHGGFGIANQIVKDLSHSGKQHSSGKVTGNLHSNTVMRSSE